ncbi:MAG TPA: hypothetical protein VGI47_08805 [Candidatus Binataceae bacterium]
MERLVDRQEVDNQNRRTLWVLIAIALGLIAASIVTILVRH